MTEFYRNNIDLEWGYTVIEADSLFYKKGEKMILVNADMYAEFICDDRFFRFVGYDVVEIPEEE